MFTLAHFSDPHIAPLPRVRIRDLANKRLLGYLSWIRRRRRIHRREILDALAEDVRIQAPDHMAITGDFTNISLPPEFEQAARWLHGLGTPEAITVVPGNHDAYVTLPWHTSLGRFADYMTSDDEARSVRAVGAMIEFPFVRRRGAVALIGLSTALPTAPGFATGKVGSKQIGTVEGLLSELGKDGLFRCVLLHHPPIEAATRPRKRLLDAPKLRAAIARAGAELVLHGHDHRFGAAEIQGPLGPVPVRGVPSASAAPGHGRPGAHYQIYGITQGQGAWRLEVRTRAYCPASNGFVAAKTEDIVVARRPE